MESPATRRDSARILVDQLISLLEKQRKLWKKNPLQAITTLKLYKDTTTILHMLYTLSYLVKGDEEDGN